MSSGRSVWSGGRLATLWVVKDGGQDGGDNSVGRSGLDKAAWVVSGRVRGRVVKD